MVSTVKERYSSSGNHSPDFIMRKKDPFKKLLSSWHDKACPFIKERRIISWHCKTRMNFHCNFNYFSRKMCGSVSILSEQSSSKDPASLPTYIVIWVKFIPRRKFYKILGRKKSSSLCPTESSKECVISSMWFTACNIPFLAILLPYFSVPPSLTSVCKKSMAGDCIRIVEFRSIFRDLIDFSAGLLLFGILRS